MSWSQSYGESSHAGDSITALTRKPPRQLILSHKKNKTHHIYIGKRDDESGYMAVAYVGNAHPPEVIENGNSEHFENWSGASAWLSRMRNFYRDGLNPANPDVFDAR